MPMPPLAKSFGTLTQRVIATTMLTAALSACSGGRDQVSTGAASSGTASVVSTSTPQTTRPASGATSGQWTSRQFCGAFIAAARQLKPPADPFDTSSQASVEEARQWRDYQATIQRLTDMSPAEVRADMQAF